jgi:hypothetical protein
MLRDRELLGAIALAFVVGREILIIRLPDHW